jgi:lupus La protein
MVRRKTEVLPPKGQFERSVYAKGFGEDEEGGKLQKRLEDFFERFGKVNAVRMRRTEGKKFKVRDWFDRFVRRITDDFQRQGSVFVEFEDFDSVDTFLKADPPPEWNGEKLLIMSK